MIYRLRCLGKHGLACATDPVVAAPFTTPHTRIRVQKHPIKRLHDTMARCRFAAALMLALIGESSCDARQRLPGPWVGGPCAGTSQHHARDMQSHGNSLGIIQRMESQMTFVPTSCRHGCSPAVLAGCCTWWGPDCCQSGHGHPYCSRPGGHRGGYRRSPP